MMMVGAIEIIAGAIVLVKPLIGGYIVAIWLTLIALTLLASGNYLDVAVRDLVMAIGAFSLSRISKIVLEGSEEKVAYNKSAVALTSEVE